MRNHDKAPRLTIAADPSLCEIIFMGSGHDHHHHHGHAAPTTRGRAFAIAIGLNLGFVVAEVAAGFVSGSMALIADAGHNLSDVLSLMLAWGASVLAAKPPSERFTYGFKSSSILAAIANAALLWVALGAILVETIRRLFDPQPVEGMAMIIVAALGIVVNGASALLFAQGRKSDLNVRAAFFHLMADAAVSAGVVIAGIAVLLTDAKLIDPITSLIITVVIAWGSWGLLRDSVRMGLLGVPEGIDVTKVRAYLSGQPGVAAVHDLHVWPMSTTETAMTAHLVMPGGHPGDDFLHSLAHGLEHDFHIGHATLQVELRAGAECALESDHVI
jgi:cobalt-zinc-cadmium efflux system protein